MDSGAGVSGRVAGSFPPGLTNGAPTGRPDGAVSRVAGHTPCPLRFRCLGLVKRYKPHTASGLVPIDESLSAAGMDHLGERVEHG